MNIRKKTQRVLTEKVRNLENENAEPLEKIGTIHG